jgi:hypothetical protein
LKTSVAEITDEGNVGVEAMTAIIFTEYNRYIRRKLAPLLLHLQQIPGRPTKNETWVSAKKQMTKNRLGHGMV